MTLQFKLSYHFSKSYKMSKKKQITLEGMKKAMAIELLPAKELKKQAEVPVDFSAFMQKALKYDIKPKKKGKK